MQSDVKRMLACSTMGQMGFMVCGAGLGLLPAAVSHLFWHGFYKAYLFLASSSIVQEKRLDKRFNLEIGNFFFSIIIALIATFLFTFISNKSIVNLDSSLVLVSVIFIAASQLSLIILQSKPFRNFAKALFAAVIIAIFYGYSVHLVEDFLQPLKINEPTELNILHYIALLILFSSWLITLMAKSQNFQKTMPNWLLPVYVKLLNSSAPNKNTITTSRKSYKF
jgi:NAD(P)H-quinone oxidoreductase subunit 5